jgi:hypothetical protein
MLVCSCILVIQAILLIVQAAGVHFTALDRLVVIICVEIPPTLTVFIMFSASSAINKSKKADFQNKTQNSRGSIMLQKFAPTKKKSRTGDKSSKGKSKEPERPVEVATAGKSNKPDIEDEPITLRMVARPKPEKAQPENPFLNVQDGDNPGGLKLVPRDPNAAKAGDSGATSTGTVPVLKLKTVDPANSGFKAPTARSPDPSKVQPFVSPRVDLTSDSGPMVHTIPGTGVRLVHGTSPSNPGSAAPGLKFVPRDPASSSAPSRKKKDPLDDSLGPVVLKMVSRNNQDGGGSNKL